LRQFEKSHEPSLLKAWLDQDPLARVVTMRENHFRLPIRARTTSLIRMLLKIL
jgi:hypothetical protein